MITSSPPRPASVLQIKKWIEANPINPLTSSYVLTNQIARDLGFVADAKLVIAALNAGYSIIPCRDSFLWRFERYDA